MIKVRVLRKAYLLLRLMHNTYKEDNTPLRFLLDTTKYNNLCVLTRNVSESPEHNKITSFTCISVLSYQCKVSSRCVFFYRFLVAHEC